MSAAGRDAIPAADVACDPGRGPNPPVTAGTARPFVDHRPRGSTIEQLRRAETHSERVATAVAMIVCPDCEPARYLHLLELAVEMSWRRARCGHDRYVPTPAGMAIVGEEPAP